MRPTSPAKLSKLTGECNDMYAMLEKNLLALSGVSRFDVKHLGFKRFLLHDKPFVVLGVDKNGGAVLHASLQGSKIHELRARFGHAICDATHYDSRFWIAIKLDKLETKTVLDIIQCAYNKALLHVSDLSRAVYTEKNPVPYDIDYHKILACAKGGEFVWQHI